MSYTKNIACGLPSVPRESMPSMYQILSWDDKTNARLINHSPPKIIQATIADSDQLKNERHAVQVKENIIENISEVKSQHPKCVGKRISKSCTKHYQLYEYKQRRGKAQSQSHCSTLKPKVQSSQVAKPTPKKLDPNNEQDLKQIEARRKRIKTFQLVTRDLPNSAFTTYYGKPAFQAYGRGNSNPNLLSHNVMPHKGDNHPKSVQSYYSALIKGKKIASTANNASHVPRKPFQEIKQEFQQIQEQVVNLPLEKPDLINNIRFTAADSRVKKDTHIPSNKIALLKQKITKQNTKKDKKKKAKSKIQQRQKVQIDDGLKYINTREDLLKILQNKKVNASKLAYKVTQCYPCEWQNEEKLKQSTKLWQNTKIAGVPSKKGEKVGDLLRNISQSPL